MEKELFSGAERGWMGLSSGVVRDTTEASLRWTRFRKAWQSAVDSF